MSEKMKKTSEEIRSEILIQLEYGPKTIAEIGEAINSNWLTTEKFINELKAEEKVIEIITTAKMRVYKRADDPAFYGLPFSEKIRKDTASLLHTIAQEWNKKLDKSPSKTVLQKIAVELIENSGDIDNVPVMRFHYGKTLALSYDGSLNKECKPFSLTEKQAKILSGLIEAYSALSSRGAQLRQYEKEDMEFYRIKEAKVIESLSKSDSKDVDKNIKDIENGLLLLSTAYPLELENIYPLFEKFVYCSTILLNLKKKEEKLESVKDIKEIFYLLWDTLTTSYFFYDAERSIEPGKMELFNQIKANIIGAKIANLSPRLEDLESEVNSIEPERIDYSASEKEEELLHELLEE